MALVRLVVVVLAVLAATAAALPVGTSYPTGYTEDEVSRPIRARLYPGTAEYDAALVQMAHARLVPLVEYADTMSSRMSQGLTALADRLGSVYGRKFNVGIHAAFVVAASPVDPDVRSQHYEGRAVELSLIQNRALELTTAIMEEFADMAIAAGFDWVHLVSAERLQLSVIPDSCQKRVDLAFLLDGSASLSETDFANAKAFIQAIVDFFPIGADETRVGMVTFAGDDGHLSTLEGVPDCPEGTRFDANGKGCICVEGSVCEGPSGSGSTDGCRTGQLADGSTLHYFEHGCTTCTCTADWPGGPSAKTNFDLGTYTGKKAVNDAVNSVAFPMGGTHTSLGLERVRSAIFTESGGARPASEGIARVLVVVTDGKANTGYEPSEEARLLREAGVTIFVLGVANWDLMELQTMASNPDDTHIFLSESFDQIYDLANRIGTLTCDTGTLLDPNDTVDTDVDDGRYLYYQPAACSSATDVHVAKLTVTSGSAYLYASWSDPNPGELNYHAKDDSADTVKELRLSRPADVSASAQLYLSVYGAALDPSHFELSVVCEAAPTTASATTTAAPTTAAPTTAAPTTAAPTTAAPTTAAPTTAGQTTAAPTTAAPITTVPTTAVPTTAAQTTAVPTTTVPTTAAPTTVGPTESSTSAASTAAPTATATVTSTAAEPTTTSVVTGATTNASTAQPTTTFLVGGEGNPPPAAGSKGGADMALSSIGVVVGLLALATLLVMLLRVRRRRAAAGNGDEASGKMFNNPIYKRPADALPRTVGDVDFGDSDGPDAANADVESGLATSVTLTLNPEYMASGDVPLQQEYTPVGAAFEAMEFEEASNNLYRAPFDAQAVLDTIAACAAEAMASDDEQFMPVPRRIPHRVSRRISRRASRDYGVVDTDEDAAAQMEPLSTLPVNEDTAA